MMAIQIKYQREIDRLEKELQSLKKQLLLTQDRNLSGKKQRKLKVCLQSFQQSKTSIRVFFSSRDH
jgi:hypothetical protein